MEKTEAIKYYMDNYINYSRLIEGLLYPDYCLQVAILLHGAVKASSRTSKWGKIYLACMKSDCFHNMDLNPFVRMWEDAFPRNAASLNTFKNGIGEVRDSFSRKGTPIDTPQCMENRKATMNLSKSIKVACRREE